MTQVAISSDALTDSVAASHDEFGLTARSRWWIKWMPLSIVVPMLPFVATKRTRDWFYWLVGEDKPFELATFVILILAAYVGFRLVLHLRRQGAPAWVWLFYAIFTLGAFVTGMEEIAWGQWIFFWKTPEFWDKVNAQHETTLHNYKALQGHTEYIRGLFVVGTMIGILLGRVRACARVAVPPILWSWVIVMLAHVLADVLNDYVDLGPNFFIDRFSEVIELMIGIVAYLYLRLNANRLGLADGRKFLLNRSLW